MKSSTLGNILALLLMFSLAFGYIPPADAGKPHKTQKITCNAECKKKALIDRWIIPKLANPLVDYCKKTARDPVHCIKWWSSIIWNESTWWQNCYNKNCTGMVGGAKSYKTYKEWVEDWVNRYNKYWYKAPNAHFFYGDRGELPKSRYCTSENSSWSDVGCPNGRKTAQEFFNSLPF